MTTKVKTSATAARPGSSVGRGTALGVGLALGGTITAFAVGNLGAPIRVVTGWDRGGADLRLREVVITASVAVALAGLLLSMLERRRFDAWRVWEPVVAVAAVVSAVPLLRLPVDAGSKVGLVVMHLLTGAAAIAGQRAARGARIAYPKPGATASAGNRTRPTERALS